MITQQLLVPLVVAVISLLCTFGLFRLMKSSATGESNWFGSKFRYGGALAGFVIIFLLLMYVYFRIEAIRRPDTPVNVNGRWQITSKTPKGEIRTGRARVWQQENDTEFSVSMELQSIEDPARLVTVTSTMGKISGRKIVWVYENSDREGGIAMTEVMDNKPTRIIMRFADFATFDFNNQPIGTAEWLREADQ